MKFIQPDSNCTWWCTNTQASQNSRMHEKKQNGWTSSWEMRKMKHLHAYTVAMREI